MPINILVNSPKETRKTIFGNIGSMLAFRVWLKNAKYLLTKYEPIIDENNLVNFDNFDGALRLLIKEEASKPLIFLLSTKKGIQKFFS